MEYKDPMLELLSSLEQIVFKDEYQKMTLTHKPSPFTNLNNCEEEPGCKQMSSPERWA